MHQIDGPRAVPAMPAARSPGTPGFFSPGVPEAGQKATAVTYDFMNALMMEVITPIQQAGLTLHKGDNTQLYQAIVQIATDIAGAELGKVEYFVRKSPPARYLKCNGQTIGSAESGATARANTDTLALYRILWADWENYLLPIQDSAGVPATRGASADADFAAGKRLPLPEIRAEHIVAWDDGRGVDAGRVFGSKQAAAGGGLAEVKHQNGGTSVGGDESVQVPADATFSQAIHTGESGSGNQESLLFRNRPATDLRVRSIALSAFIRFK